MVRTRASVRLYAYCLAVLLIPAGTASAQFQPRPVNEDAGLGEPFVIEASGGFWSPSAQMAISSESLGIAGTTIDFKRDLGLQDQRFGEIHAVLKGGRKHKLRFQYIPIRYQQEAVLTRDVIFNGQRYRIGLPVSSQLSWNAYRFGYEYDVLAQRWGFAGVLVDFKYTDVRAELDSPILSEFAHARAPIPTLGGIGRVYVTPSVSITGELSLIAVPDGVAESYDFDAHYADLDIYGTFNFSRNFGAKVGYRSLDVGYAFSRDSGTFLVKGLYFGGVVRY